MAASLQDFIPGVGLTNLPAVTGALLDEQVNAATPYTDKGIIVVTTDVAGVPVVPNATATPKWQNYIWVRIQPTTNIVSCYIWNPNMAANGSFANSLYWQLINVNLFTIANGSITGAQIANLTVQDANIGSVSWAKLTNAGAAGGALTGYYPNPTIPNSSISWAAMVNAAAAGGALTGTYPNPTLAVNGANNTNIAGSGTVNQMMFSDALNGAGTIWASVASKLVKTNALDTNIAASPLRPVIVNAAGTGFQYKAHDVLQIYFEQNSNNVSTATILAAGTTPTASNTVLATNFGYLGSIIVNAVANAGSWLLVECDINCGNTTTGDNMVVALFNGAALLDYSYVGTGHPYGTKVRLSAWVQAAAGGAYNFSIYTAAITGGSAQINIDGGSQRSTVKITEYL